MLEATRPLGRLAAAASLFLLIAFAMGPLIALAAASFVRNESLDEGVSIASLRDHPTIENHSDTWHGEIGETVADGAWTTLKVSLIVTFLSVAIALIGAYAVTRSHASALGAVRELALLGYAVPPIVLVFSFAFMSHWLGVGLGVPIVVAAHVAFCFPFCFLLAIRLMRDVPTDLERVASVDGAGPIECLWYVTLPQMRTGIFALVALAFLLSWNDVLLSTVLGGEQGKTLPVVLRQNILDVERTSNGGYASASLYVSAFGFLLLGGLRRLLVGSRSENASNSV